MPEKIDFLVDGADETNSSEWVPAAHDGAFFAAYFFGEDADTSVLNFIDPANNLALVGDPVGHPGYRSFVGTDTAQARAETPFFPTDVMTIYLVFKAATLPIPADALPVGVSTNLGKSSADPARNSTGLSLFYNSPTVFSFWVNTWNDTAGTNINVQANMTGDSAIDPTKWNGVVAKIKTDGISVRNLTDMTDEVAAAFTAGYVVDPNVNKMVIGDNATPSGPRDGSINIACAAFANVTTSDADDVAIMGQLRARCAEFGIAI